MDKITLLERPEDLLRLTISADIRYCIIALLRYLQALRPSFQENSCAVQAEVAAAPGKWFELRRRGVPTGYMQAEESRGRYSSSPPESVAQEPRARNAGPAADDAAYVPIGNDRTARWPGRNSNRVPRLPQN